MMRSLVLLGLVFTNIASTQTRKSGDWIEDYYYPLNPNVSNSDFKLHRVEIHGWNLDEKVYREFNLFKYALNTSNFSSGEEFHRKKSMYSLMKFTIESAVLEFTDIHSYNTAPDYTKPNDLSEKVTNLKYENSNTLKLSTSGFYNLANSKDIFTGILQQNDFDEIHRRTESLQRAVKSSDPMIQKMADDQVKWFKDRATQQRNSKGQVTGWSSKKNSTWYDSYLPDENCEHYFYNDYEVSEPSYVANNSYSKPNWAERIWNFRESICGTIYLTFNSPFTNPEKLLQTIRDNFILSLKMDDASVKAPSVIAVFDFSGYYANYPEWLANYLSQTLRQPLLAPRPGIGTYFDSSMIQVYPRVERNQIVMKITHKNI